MQVQKAMQNVEIGVVLWLWVTQGHQQPNYLIQRIWLPIRL